MRIGQKLVARSYYSLSAEDAFAVGGIDAPHSGGEAVAGIEAQGLGFGFVGVARHDFDFHGDAAFFDFDDEFEWHGYVVGLLFDGNQVGPKGS